MPDVEFYRKHVESFLTQTEEARTASERNRDYVDHKQWTDEEIQRLRSRNQAPIVVNRIAPKVEGLKGLLIQRNTDPKAYPRTEAHEETAHAVTDALRYVADNTDFDGVKLDVADEMFVEGYGGVIVEVKEVRGEMEIQINQIPWDRIYYDNHSRRHDFADSLYMGIIVWMDREVARQIWGDVVDEVITGDGSDGETFDDRPLWIEGDKDRARIRVAQEYTLVDGEWEMVIFCGSTVFDGPRPSPYMGEDGRPSNPIELVAAHIDRENRRFGEVSYWIDLQDEINHRRSKALHLLSQRQTTSRKGAVADVGALKRELSKADGHVEYEGEQGDFAILPTGDMAQAQFALLEEAKGEIDAVGFNAQMSGERQGNLSGKAILALQAGGSNELAALFARLNAWEKRVYRQVWLRIRQYWDRERWIRVTDDQKNLRWVGFNVEVTVQEALETLINDEAKPQDERTQAAEMFAAMMEAQDPRLAAPATIRNPVAELDVDIMLEQSLDTVNIQQEQFAMLAQLAGQRPEIPLAELLRLSTLRDKDELIERIGEAEQQRGQMLAAQAQAQQEAEQNKMRAEMEKELVVNQQKIESNERIKAAEIAVEREKAELTISVDNNRAEASNKVQQTLNIPDAGAIIASMDSLAESNRSDEVVRELISALNAPRTVERDDDGRVVGIS